jgi:hypothetical protein
MVSSVASERAFSSAGITICKRRNCLDGDIIEALQCLKTLIHQDLMTRTFMSVADEETLLDDADNQPTNQEGSTKEAVKEAEDWTWEAVLEAVVEEAGGDNDADDIVVVE